MKKYLDAFAILFITLLFFGVTYLKDKQFERKINWERENCSMLLKQEEKTQLEFARDWNQCIEKLEQIVGYQYIDENGVHQYVTGTGWPPNTCK